MPAKPLNPALDNDRAVQFLRGYFDRKDQRNRYQLKRLASSYTKPKTLIEHLVICDCKHDQ